MFSSALRSFSSNISSNYKLSDHPTSTSGPWKIFDAKHKSNGKSVSVFVFDKKTLEANNSGFGSRSGAGSLKRAHEEVVERLRKEASALARLRHPSVLELAEPVEDTRNGGLMFATEPVTASLAGLLREKDDQEKTSGVGGRSSRFVVEDGDGGRKRREIEIDELEIQKGLLQVAKGIEFLHESAGLVHANLTPDAILVNAKSDWKISGLGFSGKAEGTTVVTTAAPIALSEVLNFDPRLPRSVQLNLDYSSPDFVIDSNASPAADMFSLGLLIVALYSSPHRSPLETNTSVSTYKRLFASSSSVPTQNNNFLSSVALAKPVANLLTRLITRRPAQRLNAREFQQAEYFDNILVSTIRFLESLPTKTPNEKSQFLRGLPRISPQFSSKVLERKVLPALLEEMKDRDLIALILQNTFKMLKSMPSSRRAFTERVIPKLREIFNNAAAGKAGPAERDSAKEAGLMVLLENMRAIADNTTGNEFKDDILPIIHLSFESPTHSVVDAALGTLPVILSSLDFSTIKNEVFPIIAAVFSKTSSLGIKIKGLEALRTLCGGSQVTEGDGLNGMGESQSKPKMSSVILDRYTIQEKVVPLLKAIKTKEPAVMMATLDVFTEIGKIVEGDYLATDVLPILWGLSLGPLLNLQQFQAFMSLIRSLSTRVEQEHTRKLQELSSTHPTAASRNDFMSFSAPSGPTNGLDDSINGDGGDFEALVLGKKPASGSSQETFDPWSTNGPSVTSQLPMNPQSQHTSPTPAFSWSTPAPAPAAPRLSNMTSNSASRMTSPGNPLNTFAALQPQSTSTSSFSQPLKPSTISNAPANPWASNLTSPSSAASSTNMWASQPQQPTSTSSFGQPQQLNSSYPSFSIPPPQSSPYSTFGIAPPPASSAQKPNYSNSHGNMSISVPQQQPPNSQKQGLDKYESLI